MLNAGKQISVDDLIWEILEGDPRDEISEEEAQVGETLKGGSPRALKDDVQICVILDCCRYIRLLLMLCLILISRNSLRSGSLNQPKLAVKHERGFKLKMDIKNLDFNDQILIINSSLLGDKAKDNNSFTQRLLRWCARFVHMNDSFTVDSNLTLSGRQRMQRSRFLTCCR